MANTVDDFCAKILTLDPGIRFAGIANAEAKMMGHAYRKGLAPLLNLQQTEVSVLQSAIRMSTRQTLEKQLGETVYAFAMYKKVKRASIPIRNSKKITHVLMVSFDLEVNHEQIILDKILPEVDKFVV